MKALGVEVANEKQMRKASREVIGDNIAGESAPFYSGTKSGMDIQPGPHVFVPDLMAKIICLLEENERYSTVQWQLYMNTHGPRVG